MPDRLSGVIVSLITPFENEKPDYGKLERNIGKLNRSDVSGYLALGGNAECQSMSGNERLDILKAVSENRGSRLLLAGVSSESVLLTLKQIERYAETGADAIRLAPPHYFPYLVTDALLERYFLRIADESPLPLLLYNSPVLSGGVKISTDLAETLSKHPTILGIKDSSLTGLYKFINIRRKNPGFSILAGSASFFFPALMAGANGGDMTAANYLPEACCSLYRHVAEGNLNEARDIHGRLLAVNSCVSGRWGFCGVKAAMNIMGYEGGMPREPWGLPSKNDTEVIRQVLKSEGFQG